MGKAKKETVKDAKAVRKSALRKPGTSGAAKDASKRGKAIVAEVLSRARAATAAKRDKGKEKGKQKETKKEEKKKDDKKETKEKDKRDKEKETKEKKDGAAAKEKQDKQEKDEKAKTHEGQKETAGKEKKKKDDKNEADANSATAKRSAMDGEGEGNKKKKAKASAEEKEKGEKLKALQSRLQQIVAPKTPPPKRVRMKSPSESVSTNASAQRYAINKAKAEAHFEKIKGSLDSALKDAENQAEFDALGMLDVLDELKHGKNDKKEKTAEKETKAKPKIEAEQKKDDERKKEEEAAEEMAQELEDEAEEDDEEEQTDDEQEDSEDDAPKTVVPRCETEEEDEEQEEEEEEEEEEEDGEPEAEEENADEDEASADEESDDDGEEEGSEEAEPCADDDEEEEKEDKEESKGGKKEGRELGDAAKNTLRNSKTDKNAWDKFDRSRKTLKFPESLRPMLKRQKTELFNLWLENGRDWDKVACVVERQTETKNLARKQWTAVQAKTLKASMPEDRFQDLIKKRTEAGLYYKDDDYPDDELETWYYMPQGRVVRQDDSTSELLKVQAQKKLDRGMLNEMTGDDGPLQAGALPAVKAASIGGAQALLKALDDDGKKVTKPPKRRKDEETAEPVKPKTILESGMEALQIVLSKATTARQKSIQLKGVEFAGELATQMLGHAVEMEGVYSQLKTAVSKEEPSDREISRILAMVETKGKWFEKAEASANGMLKGSKAKKSKAKSKAKTKPGEDSAKRIRPEPSSFRESALLHKLLELVGNGGSHVATATEIARAAEIDFPHPLPDGLKKLASCGAHGACASNTERDFRRWTRGAYGFRLEPYPIKLTLEVPGECLPQEHDASVLLPHEVLGALYETDQFGSLMFGNHSGASILRFWNHLKSLPGFKYHTVLQSLTPEELKTSIPCCIHGDGAEMFRDDEFWVMNWSSAFASGGGHDCLVNRYPILIVAERQMLDENVRAGVNKTIADLCAWSLHYAALGIYPHRGFYGEEFERNTYRSSLRGQRIAGGSKLIYMAFKADLKARKQCHLLEENYLSRRMCDRCQAVQLFTMAHDPLSYKNLQENAPYTRTCKGHDEYIQGARQISPWAVVPGWQFESLTFDMMHIIFLGIAKNHIPSCLKMLKLAGYHYEVNESDEQFLKKVSFNMRQDCKDHKRYLPRRLLTLSNTGSFGQDDYCELGSRFKGQHIKTMVWWIAYHVGKLTKDSEDGEMQLLNVCAFSLAKAIELIDNSGLILSSEEASEITKFLLMHLRTTRRLASICWGNAIMAFKMRPKHHYLWHIAMDVTATKLNPRLFHVWEDEKFLGRIKRIATKCHGGTVQRRALERYVLALSNYMSSLA